METNTRTTPRVYRSHFLQKHQYNNIIKNDIDPKFILQYYRTNVVKALACQGVLFWNKEVSRRLLRSKNIKDHFLKKLTNVSWINMNLGSMSLLISDSNHKVVNNIHILQWAVLRSKVTCKIGSAFSKMLCNIYKRCML